MVRTSQDGTELGLLREGQISFLGEGGGDGGEVSKKRWFGTGVERKTMRLQALQIPMGRVG